MKKITRSVISQMLGQGDSTRRVWSNGGMMISRGKLKKTLLWWHFIRHKSQIETPED
jgi:hypothetical protein